ncbi:MAG: amidohydrolase family protein, partial [Longimicrobiales bacterium]
AKPVKYGGVSREDALRMLTLNPARMMHIDDMVGSLEPGKQGDVVLLNGDPFDAYVRVEKTVVDGLVYYDLSDEAGTRDEPFEPVAALEPGAPVSDPDSVTLSASAGAEDPTGDRAGQAEARGEAPLLEGRSFTLVGATVHPIASPPVEDGVVVVRNGMITAVGPRSRVQVPGDFPVVDLSGRHVYPGMIDGLTILGLWEFGQSPNATDLSDTGVFNPHLRAVSAVQMDEPGIGVARANGITAAFVAQQAGIIEGTGGAIQLAGRNWRESAIEEEAALVVDFPAPRAPGDEERGEDDPTPGLEGDEMESLVEVFERSRLYVDSATVRDRGTEAFWPNREAPDRAVLQGMAPASRGEIPVLFRAQTEWQLRTLFVFLDRFPEVRAVVVGGGEAFSVADELAEREIPVILTSSYSPMASRDHSVTAGYRNAALLDRAGVRIAFSSAEHAADGVTRNLPYHAAHSVAFGLDRESAIRAVTLGPAEILGLDDRVGTLEAGKRADLIVTDGDPLQFLTRVRRIWIDGQEVDPEDNRHQRLYEEYRE